MAQPAIRVFEPRDKAACEGILRALPDWFGIEDSIVAYVRDLSLLETVVAEISGEIAGFLTLKTHNPHAAEIIVMAVAPNSHAMGIGRALVERAETILRSRHVRFLQVKTLGPSRPCEFYERTRGFYLRLGFTPLEENDLWGEGNPCLIMVKQLPAELGSE